MKPKLVDHKLFSLKPILPKMPKIYSKQISPKKHSIFSKDLVLSIIFILACVGIIYLRWSTKMDKKQKQQKTKEMLEEIKSFSI